MCFDSPGNHLWGEISGKQKANAKHVLLLQGSSASLFCSTDTEEHLQNLDPCSSLDYFQITLSWTQSDRLPVPSCNRWDGRHWTLIAARPKLLQKTWSFCMQRQSLVSWGWSSGTLTKRWQWQDRKESSGCQLETRPLLEYHPARLLSPSPRGTSPICWEGLSLQTEKLWTPEGKKWL